MLCSSCKNLNFKIKLKICFRCSYQKEMSSLSVICDTCSENDMQCSFCLRHTRSNFSKPKSGCESCGN